MKDLQFLKTVSLLNGISEQDLDKMLNCLNAQEKKYKKDSVIILSGDPVPNLGIVTSGRAQVVKEDITGSRTLLSDVERGEMFAEAFACANMKSSPVTVLAATDCSILWLTCSRIITACPCACTFHSKLTENMVQLIAQKNISLNERLDILSKRTTREKIAAYLMMQARKANSCTFTIPYSRNELADSLCVERSAMSRELSRMRDEGLLKYRKNKFELLNIKNIC